MSLTVIPERLGVVRRIGFSVGAHGAPSGPTEDPCAFCVMEGVAYVTGCKEWTDRPRLFCPAVEAYVRRANDDRDDAARQRLGTWVLDNLGRLAATANDGGQTARGYALIDHAIRSLAPWLEMGGAGVAAMRLDGLPAIVDSPTANAARAEVRSARDAVPPPRRAQEHLWEAVRRRVARCVAGDPTEVVAAADAVAAETVAEVAALAVDVATSAVVERANRVAVSVTEQHFAAVDRAEVCAAYLAPDNVAGVLAGVSDRAVSSALATYSRGTWSQRKSASEAVKASLRRELAGLVDSERAFHGVKPAGETVIEALERMLAVTERRQAGAAGV